jgi:hypothetical protein
VTAEIKSPVWPLPVESLKVVPDVSSSRQYACGPSPKIVEAYPTIAVFVGVGVRVLVAVDVPVVVGIGVFVTVGVIVAVPVAEGAVVALAALVGAGLPPLALLTTIGRKTLDVVLVELERARSAETAWDPTDADQSSQPSTRSPRHSTTRAKTSRFIRHHDPALEVSPGPDRSIERIGRIATDYPNSGRADKTPLNLNVGVFSNTRGST